ncbi:SIT4 associated protein [Acrasis kona]|uniref:SIT4 associated protein n=1 Tax=Acrasis kona TaxID=1008807 RepID=A0AAW2YPD5_9EUKA
MNDHLSNKYHHDDDDDDEEDGVQDTDAFTSIWDLVPGYQQSSLDAMLEKADTTLEQVLDEDTLIQELKNANPKVISFLAQDDNLDKMVEYLTLEHYQEDLPSVENMTPEQVRTYFKCPFVVSELISCEVEDISDGLIQHDRILKLLQYLSTRNKDKAVVNSSQSQYFIRSLQHLLQKHYKTISQIIMKDVALELFVQHIGQCDMDGLILKLLGFENDADSFEEGFSAFATQQRIREIFLMKQRGNDQELQDRKAEMRNWAIQQDFTNLLIKQCTSSDDQDVHRNVFCLLCDLIDKGNNVITNQVLQDDFISRVLDVMLSMSQSSIFVHATTFLAKVLEAQDEDQHPYESCRQVIASRHADFKHLLKQSPPNQPNVLGEIRLKTVEHYHSLYRLKVDQVMRDVELMNDLLDLFFTFAFNNLLHCNVFGILQIILESEHEDLKLSVIKDSNLLNRLLQAHEQNEAALKEPKGFRKGYMGFVVELSNMIRKLSINEEQPIGAYANSVAGWNEYLSGPVQERNLMNERQVGGPVGNSFSSSLYQFPDDDDEYDDEDYAYDDDDDDDDSDDDDDEEVVIRKSPHHHRTGVASQQQQQQQQQQVDHDSSDDDDDDDDVDDDKRVVASTNQSKENEQEEWQADFDEQFV